MISSITIMWSATASASSSCGNAPAGMIRNESQPICGISAAEIEWLAGIYGTTRPALIRANYGLQRVRGGGMATRNIACLPALVGAFRDAAGGFFLSTSGNFDVDQKALSRPDLLAGRKPRTINMSTIGHALTERQRANPRGHRLQLESGGGGAGFQTRGARIRARGFVHGRCWSTFRPTPPTMRISCCRPRLSSSIWTWSNPTGTTTWWPTIPRLNPWAKPDLIRSFSGCWRAPWDSPSRASTTPTRASRRQRSPTTGISTRCARPAGSALDLP